MGALILSEEWVGVSWRGGGAAEGGDREGTMVGMENE